MLLNETAMKLAGLFVFSLLLIIGSESSAQGEQSVDAKLHKAQELEKLGEYLKAAEIYEDSVHEEKKSPDPVQSNIVTALNQAAYYYSLAGKYKTATKRIEEALKMAKKLERKDLIAECLNRFGHFYSYLNKFDVAVEYYLEALDIYRNRGLQGETAASLNYVGNAYNSSGKYDTAIKYFEEALDIDKKLGREGNIDTDFDNIGKVYESVGKYDNAIAYYERALSIDRKLGLEEKIANDLNNIGNIYKSWEQYITAIKYYEKSLDIYRKLRKEDSTVFRDRIKKAGDICKYTGQYEKAVTYYKEALDIYRNLDQSDNAVACINSIGSVYQSQGNYQKAVGTFEDALSLARKSGREGMASVCLKNIGSVYDILGKYGKAIEYYQKALDIDRKLKEELEEVLVSKNLDLYYRFYWNKHDKIIYPYEQAQSFKKKIGKDTDIYRNLNKIGMVFISQEKYKTAINYFKEAVSVIEELRKTTTGEIRRSFLNDLLSTYQLLTFAYIKDRDVRSAFQSIELARAKLLIERFAGSEKNIKKQNNWIWLQEVEDIQKTLDDDTAIIIYANVNRENLVQIIITGKGITTGKEVSLKSFVQSSLDKYEMQIRTLLVHQRNLSKNKNDFNNIINYYGSLLREPPFEDQRGGGIDVYRLRDSMHKDYARDIGAALYKLLIKPVEEQIESKKNLIIIPDGILTFLPFGTLVDENGQYLIEKHSISYVQSLDIRKLIMKRKYEEDRKPLVVFGGAVYEDSGFKAETIENRVQLAVLIKNIYSHLENIQMDLVMKNLYPDFENVRSVGSAYRVLGISSWHDLPHTLREVYAIKKVISRSDIFTGESVSERAIKKLSDNWAFYNYKAIHFATHGLVVQEVPELSALVLSQFKDREKEDGYLRTEEIAKMEIKADLVTLSAFETGLGEIYDDDGFTRIIHSFIVSGAKAVSLSLWKAGELSTSQFMVAMYGMVQDKGISYKEAMTEVKRQFIHGDFGEKYKAPYYWAPFLYYGN